MSDGDPGIAAPGPGYGIGTGVALENDASGPVARRWARGLCGRIPRTALRTGSPHPDRHDGRSGTVLRPPAAPRRPHDALHDLGARAPARRAAADRAGAAVPALHAGAASRLGGRDELLQA